MATFLLRLPDAELDALREAAAHAHRSMNELARDAIRTAVDHGGRDEQIRTLTRRIITEDAGLLERLADR